MCAEKRERTRGNLRWKKRKIQNGHKQAGMKTLKKETNNHLRSATETSEKLCGSVSEEPHSHATDQYYLSTGRHEHHLYDLGDQPAD